jgi:hypothetical protein
MLYIGPHFDARVIVRRHIGNASTSESCIATEDLDGDGLAGCADADCWFTCTPACPPYATCP